MMQFILLLSLLLTFMFHWISLEAADPPPNLIDISFDLGLGNLTLQFDELVDVTTFQLPKLTLYYKSSNIFHNFTIQKAFNRLALQKNSTQVSILLSSNDYARFKYISQIDSLPNPSFSVTIANGTVLSANGTASAPSNLITVSAENYIPDKITPFINFFGLNMNNSNLSITFTEPMDFSTFTLQGIAVQGYRNMKIAPPHYDQYYQLHNIGSEILRVHNYNRTIDVDIGQSNMNEIKAQIGLCQIRQRCYLSAYGPFVNDTAGNALSLVAFDSINAVEVFDFGPDVNHPTIFAWDYDCNNGFVRLEFTETVYLDFFNFSKILFYDGGNVTIRLENPINISTTYSEIVYFTLNAIQLQEVQDLNLLTKKNNSFLLLEPGLVVDTSANQNIFLNIHGIATRSNPLQIRTILPDIVKPRLIGFELDLLIYQIRLHFSKAIKLSSFHPEFMILQSDSNAIIGTEQVIFTTSDVTVLTTNDGTEIVMALQNSLISRLRSFFYLAKSVERTYMAVSYQLVTDRSPQRNTIVDITTAEAIQVSELVADATAPVMSSWEINMNQNMVLMSFSKPVELSTLDATEGYISSDAVILPSSKVVYFSDLLLQTTGIKSLTLSFAMPLLEVLNFKSDASFCTSPSNCFLTFTSSFISSLQEIVNGTANYAVITPVIALPPTVYDSDTTPIKLNQYSINLNPPKIITLNFSKPVIAANFTFGGFNVSDVFLSKYTITQMSLISNLITLELTLLDQFDLQASYPLATTKDNLLLSIASGTVTDVFHNTLSVKYKRPASISSDVTLPKLLGLYLEPTNKKNFTLYFNKVVQVARMNISEALLVYPSGATFPLTGARIILTGHGINISSSSVVVDLTPIIARLTSVGLVQSQLTTRIILTSKCNIIDLTPNQNRLSTMSVLAGIYDGVTFTTFRLDMLRGEILLEMPFVVDISSITASEITIFSSTTRYSLTSLSSFLIDRSGPMLILTLIDQDRDNIQQKFDLSNAKNLKINIFQTAVKDVNNKILADSITIGCSMIVQDNRLPYIKSYSVDLGSGLLTIIFSKNVLKSTLRTVSTFTIYTVNPLNTSQIESHLTLFNLKLSSGVSTTGVTSSNYASTIVLDLNSIPSRTTSLLVTNNAGYHVKIIDSFALTCRETILLAYPLLSSTSQTYLTVGKGTVYDSSSPANALQPLTLTEKLQPTVISSDTTAPQLLNFILDLNERVLLLNFTEAIDVTQIAVNYITLAAGTATGSENYTLTSSSAVKNTLPNRIVKISLSSQDVNAMMLKAPRLVISEQTTYLSVLANAFFDLASPPNGNLDIYFRYGVMPSLYVADRTLPTIVSYNISLMNGILDILFSEVVSCRSIVVSRLFFQDKGFIGTLSDDVVRLSSESYCFGINYSLQLRIIISFNDLNLIKRAKRTVKSFSTTYLRVEANAFRDTFNNSNVAISDGNAIQVTRYIPDNLRPELIGYSMRSSQMLHLYFTKPMRVGSLQIPTMTFQDTLRYIPGSTLHYPLRNSQVFQVSESQTEIILVFNDDFLRINGNSDVFDLQFSTYLNFPGTMIRDSVGNFIVPISANNSLLLGPAIFYWDLNLNDQVILLSFTEEISGINTLQGLTLHNKDDSLRLNLTTNYPLNGGGSCVTGDSITFLCPLSDYDLNQLKLSGIVQEYAIFPTSRTVRSERLTSTYRNNSYYYVDPRYNIDYNYPVILSAELGYVTSAQPDNFISSNLKSIQQSFSRGAIELRYFYPDITPPICESFSLDLSKGFLDLYFTEPIDLFSIQYSGITLFSSIDGAFITLTGQGATQVGELVNQTVAHIPFATADLIAVKRAFRQGKVLDRLVLQDGSIIDLSMNELIGNDPAHPILAHLIVNDTVPPTVLSYVVDLSTFIFTITFDEEIDLSTFHPYNLYLLPHNNLSDITYLQNNPGLPASSSYNLLQLSNYTIITLDTEDARVVYLDLEFLAYDQYQVEILMTSFPSSDRVFSANRWNISSLVIEFVEDIFGNQISSSLLVSPPTSVIPRTKSLNVDSYDVIIGSGATSFFNIYFSNVINISTFDCTDYVLISDRASSPAFTLSFTKSDCHIASNKNDRFVAVELATSLFTSIVGHQLSTTFLIVPTQTSKTKDLYGNSLTQIIFSSAMVPGPNLLKASLDMNHRRLVLVFSMWMDVSTTDIEKFTFISAVASSTGATNITYTMQSSIATAYSTSFDSAEYYPERNKRLHINESVVLIHLSQQDFFNLQVLDVQPRKIYLNIASGAMFSPYSRSVISNNRFIIQRLVEDTIVPQIVNITLDMGTQQLILQMSEPIRSSSIILTRFALQSVSSLTDNIDSRSYFALTGGDVIISSIASTKITVNFTHNDADAIKLNPFIAVNSSSSYLTIEYGSLADYAGNFLPQIAIFSARKVDLYVADTISPYIEAFTLNLDVTPALLILDFSEPVLASSLNLTQIFMQSRFAIQDGVGYRLTGGNILSSNSDVITIELLQDDINAMKLIPGLVRRKQSTFIVTTSILATDLAGNYLLPNIDGNALLCDVYIANTRPPEINGASMNMITGVLELTFNEPVSLRSVNITALTFIASTPSYVLVQVQSQNISSIEEVLQLVPSFALTSSSKLITSNSSTEVFYEMSIQIQVSHSDLNAIKSSAPLATNQKETNFIYLDSFISDFNGLAIASTFTVDNFYPVACTTYIADDVRPTILYYNLDMNAGTLSLKFSKAVNPQKMKLQQMILQNTPTRRFGQFIAITNGSISQFLSDDMEIQLPLFTLTYMKFYSIGFNMRSTYLSWNHSFIQDYAGNEIVPVWDASVVGNSPISPANLTLDKTPPSLLRWYLNRQTMELFAYFDEPVYVENLSNLYLINSAHSETYRYAVSPNSTYTFEEENRVLIIKLINYCQFSRLEIIVTVVGTIIQCSNPLETPFYAFINTTMINPQNSTLSLTNSNISIIDASSLRNLLQSISPAVKEGRPGEKFIILDITSI